MLHPSIWGLGGIPPRTSQLRSIFKIQNGRLFMIRGDHRLMLGCTPPPKIETSTEQHKNNNE